MATTLDSTGDERRQYFRLRFPRRSECPLLLLETRSVVVVELAEKGMRIAAQDLGPSGTVINGTLRFPDQRSLPIDAKVLRLDRQETILCDLRGVTMSDMLAEQRRLMKKYAATEFLVPRQG